MSRHDQIFDRTVEVAGTQLELIVPTAGDVDLLHHRASTRYSGAVPGQIDGTDLVLSVQGTPLTEETVVREMGRFRVNFDSLTAWLNADLEQFCEQLRTDIRNAIHSRRSRLLADRQLDAALSIPVLAVPEGQSIPVMAHRRVLRLADRQQRPNFTPEWAIDDAHYEEILEVCTHWSRGMERSPNRAAKFDEETLRDMLLITLNSHWEGKAGAEMFNGSGKTDILIREDNRNVFIAECKIWSGPKAAADAIDQLHGYLAWRDCKAALIMFIKNANPQKTIGALNGTVSDHPRTRMSNASTNPASRSDFVLTADEDGRSVSLALLPVVLVQANG